jgi:hypothetical protein
MPLLHDGWLKLAAGIDLMRVQLLKRCTCFAVNRLCVVMLLLHSRWHWGKCS